MVSILLASHGNFAEGILQSGQMLFGPQDDVAAVKLTPDEGPDDLHAKMLAAIQGFSNQNEVLILVDLFGGTPYNQANQIFAGHEDKWAIVTGLNLPMLIEAYSLRLSENDVHSIASQIISSAQDGVKGKPDSVQPQKPEASVKANSSAKTGKIAPGTVLGDGHIKYVLARIDSRLLHGQIATSWNKETKPDRIIVVSDSVSRDKLRKQMIVEVAPPGVYANVIPISKLIEIDKDPRFGDTRALLLFETPQDALRVIKGGVGIQELNVGSLAHAEGKVAVNKALSLNEDDVQTFDELKQMGVKFDVRKVPADSRENMDSILAKARKGLKM